MNLKFKPLAVIGTVLLALCAQVVAQPTPQRMAILAGKLLDVKSGKTLTNQVILIDGEKIVSVGAGLDISGLPPSQVIDLSHATVLPGLIDAHVHLTGDPKHL